VELYFEIAGSQFIGARDYQEDAFLTTYLDDEGTSSKSAVLALIADGMGGHAAGNIAANLVVSTFNGSVTKGFGQEEFPPLLRECVASANHALKESIRETPALDGMGCTLVAVALSRGKLWWVSVGDSHLYLLRDRELTKKNEDHSYGGYLERMKAQGVELDPDPSLSRNMLMSAITGEEIAEIDCPEKPLQLRAGDRLILASDGLDTLSVENILQGSAWSKSAKECVDNLLKAVEDADRPRQDNSTVIVIDVLQRASFTDTQNASAESTQAAAKNFRLEHAQTSTLSTTPPPRVAKSRAKPLHAVGTKTAGSRRRNAAGAFLIFSLLIAGLFFIGKSGKNLQPDEDAEPAAAPHAVDAPESDRFSTQTAHEKSPPQPKADPSNSEPPPTRVDDPSPGATFQDPLASGGEPGPIMIALAGGTFKMGSSSVSLFVEERPQHEVVVKPFAISKYEITIAEYLHFAKATGRKLPSGLPKQKSHYPMHLVSWEDAHAYTRWLSKETGSEYRLPSEAEWEYAALGGTDTPYWWGFEVGQNQAHCQKCETGLDPEQPTRVGRFDANPFRLHDTAGNVAEWVHDCFHESYDGAPTDGGVWEGGDCTHRLVRGGSFHSAPPGIRSRARSKHRPNDIYDTVGIRVVRDLKMISQAPSG
jgi:formylglycine-generating enzyme required for sulfatase activity/serine/threonine protein phosphatase PrpC